jgi:predicted DNA-binding WGR domain protein
MSRFYNLDVQQTLFGEWSFVQEWGRIGRAGTVRIETLPIRGIADVALIAKWSEKLRKGLPLVSGRSSSLPGHSCVGAWAAYAMSSRPPGNGARWRHLLGAAAVGEHVGHGRRRGAAPGPVIHGMRPKLADAGAVSPGIEHRHRHLVAEHARHGLDQCSEASCHSRG